ncbi:unnamed protein product [marine sediment metagenome]|uniref:Uncharacterized protein n=1 Tax=marine sediment metagenome TaxID=412755 RepID=X1TJ31_9ZZZZ
MPQDFYVYKTITKIMNIEKIFEELDKIESEHKDDEKIKQAIQRIKDDRYQRSTYKDSKGNFVDKCS